VCLYLYWVYIFGYKHRIGAQRIRPTSHSHVDNNRAQKVETVAKRAQIGCGSCVDRNIFKSAILNKTININILTIYIHMIDGDCNL